jgi:hypothetical protein
MNTALRCTTSAAAGNGLGTTIKYLRSTAGLGLGTKIKYLRRLTSSAAGNSLCTTTKYVRGAAGIGLGTSMKYLRRTKSAAANSSLGTTIKYLVNENAGAGNKWAKAHVHKSWARIQMNPPCSVAAFVGNSVTQGPTPGHVPRSVCVWGPRLLAVFIFKT